MTSDGSRPGDDSPGDDEPGADELGVGERSASGWGPDPRSDLDTGLTPEELVAERAAAREALRRLHVPAGGVCGWCGQPFPCPDSQVMVR